MIPTLLLALAGELLRNGADTVEFLGLEHTTAAQAHAALGGGDGHKVHYCAADLIAKAGYAEASVLLYPSAEGGMDVVVRVVEPERKAQLHLREAPARADLDATPLQALTTALDADEPARNAALLFAGSRRTLTAEALASTLTETLGESPAVAPVFAALDAVNAERHIALAADVAAHAGPASTRRAALLVLAAAPDRDAAWLGLVRATLDSDQQVRDDARTALHGLLRTAARPVDWAPVRDELIDLFAGSNLWALPPVIEALVATGIDPALAQQVIAAQPFLLLEAAGAAHAPTREPARRLLARAAGHDEGEDMAAWRRRVAEFTRAPATAGCTR